MSGGMGGETTGASIVLTTKGDIVGYDTARKRIGIGSDDDVLTADSTNADGLAWKTAGGGGQLELLDTHEATGTESTYTYTPSPALDLDTKYEEIIVIAKGKTSDSLALLLKINAQAEYHTTLTTNILGTITGTHTGSASSAELISTSAINVARGFNSNIHISKEVVDYSISLTYYGFANVSTRAVQIFSGGTIADSSTTITSIQIFTSTSTWIAGTTINTYGVKKV